MILIPGDMKRAIVFYSVMILLATCTMVTGQSVLEIRQAGENSVRVTLLPVNAGGVIPSTPLLAEGREYPAPFIKITEADGGVTRSAGN